MEPNQQQGTSGFTGSIVVATDIEKHVTGTFLKRQTLTYKDGVLQSVAEAKKIPLPK